MNSKNNNKKPIQKKSDTLIIWVSVWLLSWLNFTHLGIPVHFVQSLVGYALMWITHMLIALIQLDFIPLTWKIRFITDFAFYYRTNHISALFTTY